MALSVVPEAAVIQDNRQRALGNQWIAPYDQYRLSTQTPMSIQPHPIHAPSITPDQSVTEWYSGSIARSGFESAQAAYNEARTLFRGQLSNEELDLIFPRNSTTILDVQQAVLSAKQKYEKSSPQSKVKKWLSSCSTRVMYYGVIMDTLSQHHPEYVSLAWGAIKFLFIAVINHEELLMQISKTVARIADVLPRAELASNLYQTDRMNHAVGQLYAKIMSFVQNAVKWYKMGKIKHSWTAIAKPYALSFKDIVEEVGEASRNVDKEASAASRAEIRGLHLQVLHLSEVSKMNFDRQISMTTNISNQLEDQTQWIQSSQIAHIKSLKMISSLPSSASSLEFCRSLRNRRRAPALIDLGEISKLERWHKSQNTSSTLIAQARGLRTSATDFAIDYVELLRDNNTPVIWLLPDTNIFEEKNYSLSDVILVLVMQILELNPRVLVEGSFPVTINHFQDIEAQQTESEEDGFILLARCLERISQLYILVDMSLINAIVGYKSTRAAAFIKRLQEIITSKQHGGVKLVLASWKSASDQTFGDNNPQIYVDGPLGGHSKQKQGRSNRMLSIGRTTLRRSLYSV